MVEPRGTLLLCQFARTSSSIESREFAVLRLQLVFEHLVCGFLAGRLVDADYTTARFRDAIMNNRANLIRAIAPAHKLNKQGNERLVRQFLQLQPIRGILIRRLSLYKHSLVGTIHSGLRSRLIGIAIPVQSTKRSEVSQIGLVEECTVSGCRLTAEVVLFSSTSEKPREGRPPPTSPSASRRTHSEPQNICGPVPGVVVHNPADNHLYTPPTDHRRVIQYSGV